ncbi:hypothetical protein HNY73_021145 [Argiope bruennichi]|uniref:Uncharacterized protein n=1 Tax=Argiope bruennichi TaxID=94029 RepID=A0A8T0EAF0_ARGBR|nr:hypothetical protein HNY73_021145 [Argiope bruennichi]
MRPRYWYLDYNQHSRVLNNQKRYNHIEETSHLSQPNIEVKFLEKSCSLFSSSKSHSEETKLPEQIPERESPEKYESKYLPLPDFEVSGTFEASGEFLKENDSNKRQEDLGSIDDATSKPKYSGRNSLKLAIRSKSDGIFEDCSTYNISCPDASPEFRSNEIFTNSIAGYSSSASLETSSETNYTCSDSEISSSNTLNSPDEQTSLCDTFFTHLDNNDGGQLLKGQFQYPRPTSSKTPEQAGRSNKVTREDGVEKSEDVVDTSRSQNGGRRNSKKSAQKKTGEKKRKVLDFTTVRSAVSLTLLPQKWQTMACVFIVICGLPSSLNSSKEKNDAGKPPPVS